MLNRSFFSSALFPLVPMRAECLSQPGDDVPVRETVNAQSDATLRASGEKFIIERNWTHLPKTRRAWNRDYRMDLPLGAKATIDASERTSQGEKDSSIEREPNSASQDVEGVNVRSRSS